MRLCAVGPCPHCGFIQAFFTSYKTRTCTRCGKRFEIRKTNWMKSGLSPKRARQYLERLRGKNKRMPGRFVRKA